MKTEYGYDLNSFDRPDLYLVKYEVLIKFIEEKLGVSPLLDYEEYHEIAKYEVDCFVCEVYGSSNVVIDEKTYNELVKTLKNEGV